MSVVLGQDTYGRVKIVDKTAVVTSFWMAQMLPVWPLRSYYVWGTTTRESSGVPFVAHFTTVTMNGMELDRVDRTSVAIAFIRAALAAIAIGGFIIVFTAFVSSFNGQRADHFARTASRVGGMGLVAAIAGGLLTYIVPTSSRRERAIRKYCGEVLGVSIDPALVTSDVVATILDKLPELGDSGRPDLMRTRLECVQELVRIRCRKSSDRLQSIEARTDELLARIQHLDSVVPMDVVNFEAEAP